MFGGKWIIGGGITGLVALGVLGVSRLSLSNPWLDGEKEPAKLGDLVIPVTATGTVEANKFVTIKSKASGQVDRIHVVEGQPVKAGDILVELDPVDEKRNLEAAQANLDRAKSAYEKAKIALDNQKRDLPIQTREAEARLRDAEARLKEAEYRWDRMKGLRESNVAGDVEAVTVEAAFETARAARDQAEAALERAKNNEELVLQSAREDLAQAEAAYKEAQKKFDEAKLRLEETTVRARGPGMVYNIVVRQGEMIQSGTQGFTGGTPVMTLADVSAVYVTAQVDEADIGAIRRIAPEYAIPGRDATVRMTEEEYGRLAEARAREMEGRLVEVTVEAYRGETYQGVIERILPEPVRVNNALAFNVRVRLVGDDLQKLIGLQADLAFTTEKLENVVLVKNEALHSEGRDCFVYIPKQISGSRRLGEEKVPVKIGTTDGTYTEIVKGIEPGQDVWVKRPRMTDREKQQQDGD